MTPSTISTARSILGQARTQALKAGRSRSGTTAIEYAMIATLIAGALAGLIMGIGQEVMTNLYMRIAAAFGAS